MIKWLLLIGGIFSVMLYSPRISNQPRGIRNNNPGNIKKTSIDWLGETDGDDVFETFGTPQLGIRALAKLLTNYHNAGFNTVHKIIGRYAPPSENNTESYISSVEKMIGKNRFDVLRFPDDLEILITAIIKHENGVNPYPTVVVRDGIKMVG